MELSFAKIVNSLKPLSISEKKLHCRCSISFSIRLCKQPLKALVKWKTKTWEIFIILANFVHCHKFLKSVCDLQSFTKYLRLTLVFMWNSTLREKFIFCSFLLVLTKFSIWKKDLALGYYSMKFRHFQIFPNFPSRFFLSRSANRFFLSCSGTREATRIYHVCK